MLLPLANLKHNTKLQSSLCSSVMPIAELFLSSVFKTLLNQLSSEILSEYASINGISQKLTYWERTLRVIESVMDSAEERQMDGDSAVHNWLTDLRDVAYDMEDLLDDFSIEAKRNASKSQSLSAKHLPSCLIACCSRIDPHTLLKDHRMANEIEEVDRRLEQILRQKDILHLVESLRSRVPASFGQSHFTTTALPESKFVGREKHIEELLAQLTGIEVSDDSLGPFTVVSIVGMGGLGKTTLAQELYNHESVSSSFNVRTWTCVSDIFDRVAITKSVLKCVDPSLSCEGQDLNWLQGSLKQKLSGRKFLVVLDDVWNENYAELESLLKPFFSGSRGSKILLTTRNKEVAKRAGDCSPRELDLLSPDDCLSLLAYHAIGKESFDSQPHLVDVAVQLAEKCMGLPLAAKTIGGLLRFESDNEKWKQVLHNGIWTGRDGRDNIPTALKLSYIHLPIHLKRCFAVCALFPKDYVFDGDELIRLWIAQGLLHKTAGTTYQDVGMDYLSQLEARSLLQKAGMEPKTWYSMHDLINDLAKSIVGGTYFSSDEYRGYSCGVSLANVRHAAMVTLFGESCLPSRVDVYHSMKKLRTFMPFQISRFVSSNVYVSNKVIRDLIMNMKLLRMLSLRYFCITEVPDRIGELKLLRSLDFSHTDIDKLPESICELLELRFLLLQGCHRLKELPRDIHKLTNLLHLDITSAIGLKEMPPRIGDLTNLEILSSFVVGKEAGQHLKELGPLKGLHGDLRICNLLEVDDVGDARIANLHGMERVSKLSFDWGWNVGISRDNDHQLKILDHLQPPRNIECVSIYHYGGRKFSSWFGNPCMDNVVSITLLDCKSVESLPPFGRLPSLERLDIRRLEAVSMIGAEFYGTDMPFHALKSLSFHGMLAWEEWSSCDHPFPHLCNLTLMSCPELKGGLPGRLDSLFKLQIKDCPFLETSGDTLRLPSLREMDITNCDDQLLKCLVDVTSMTTMTISNVPQLVFFDGRFSSYWIALEEILIKSCPRFKSFVDGDPVEQVPLKLKKLVIKDIADIERLPDDWYCLRSLKEMTIQGCPKLSLFPNAGLPPDLRTLNLYDCPNLPASEFHSMRLLESLRELKIYYCGGLTTLPDSLQHMSNLSKLDVLDCEALEVDCFPALPRNLVHFELARCPKVKSLPHDMPNLTSLKTLSIMSCHSISCLPRGGLPPNLEVLGIGDCQNLNQPLADFPALPRNLIHFQLHRCPKVKSLPHDMRNLTSLKTLSIMSCYGISCLPRGGLPPNLEVLEIVDCQNLNQPLEEWGLAGLTALRELWIGGEMGCVDEMVCFPSSSSDACHRLLPSSLMKLIIERMKKVERLAHELRANLTSLKELCISDCWKMREFPEDGLPDSLELLRIVNCPLLEERCQGDYRPLLQLLPPIRYI